MYLVAGACCNGGGCLVNMFLNDAYSFCIIPTEVKPKSLKFGDILKLIILKLK